MPVARKVLGDDDRLTLKIRKIYGLALLGPAASLDGMPERRDGARTRPGSRGASVRPHPPGHDGN